MPFDVPTLIAELGGGLAAVSLIAMAMVVVVLFRRLMRQQDERIADHKAHTAQIMEAMKTLDRAIEYADRRNGNG